MIVTAALRDRRGDRGRHPDHPGPGRPRPADGDRGRRGQIRPYAAGSPHFADDTFHNTEPSHVLAPGETTSMIPPLIRHRGPANPTVRIPLVAHRRRPQAAELDITWLGHATTLIEIDGQYVLTDPVWSERVSPSPNHRPGPAAPDADRASAELPRLDAIVISHDHYDHLDLPTVRQLLAQPDAHRSWCRSASARICAAGGSRRTGSSSWTGTSRPPSANSTLTCTESRHFSGRGLRRNTTLWCSWAIAGPAHRVYFGGDTGYTAGVHRDRRAIRAVRHHRAADRRLRRAVAGHPPQPGGGGAGPPDLRRRPFRADPLGHLRPGVAHLGRTGRAAAGRRYRHADRRAPARRNGSTPARPRPPDGWWRTLGDPAADPPSGAASAAQRHPSSFVTRRQRLSHN